MADKDKWWVSFSTEAIILCCALCLGVLVVGEFFWWQATEFFEVENAGDQPSELLIVTLGAIGAACGLILAARRSAKFSEQVEIGQKQVETGQKQLFNEELGRGAELLTKQEKPMRRTGIRILEDLAETKLKQGLSKENIKQTQLIMRIIHDFVHEKTRPPPEKKENLETRIEKGKEKLDIALGIKTLASLYNESGRLVELEELVQFQGCRLEGLNFTDANLQGADFWGASLQGALFYNAKLEWADCSMVDFSDAQSLTRNHVNGMIFLTDHHPMLPKRLEQFLDKRRSYEFKEDPDDESNPRRYFVKSDAEWSGRWVNEYLAEIGIINPEDD